MNTASHLTGRQQPVRLLHPTAESVLVFDLQPLLSRAMGGLLPPQLPLAERSRVLDVACGSGTWALELAFAYPAVQVEGVDSDPNMVSYARARARVQRLDNASFSVGNMYHLAHIADDTFDLVHVRFLAGIVEPQAWTSLFKELLRVCRPGGAVCWSEWGELLTNSPACNEGYKRLQHALALAGATTKVTLLMKTLLEEQECGNVQQSMVTLDFSVGTAGYTSFLPHMQTLCYSVESLLERMGLGEVEELARLERQVWLEVLADSFYATWPMATVWGRSAHNRV